MEIVENKLTNLFFKIAIAVGLGGIFFYFIYEIANPILVSRYQAFVIIADLIGIFALIAIILWLFIPSLKAILKNLAIILLVGYAFFFVFANFFVYYYVSPPFLTYFEYLDGVGISFIGTLLIVLFSIGLIVIFSIDFGKREEFAIFEKFIIIIWVLLVGIYDYAASYTLRPFLDVSFVRSGLELILILFAAILLIIKFFVGINEKIWNLLMLLLVNAFFISLAILSTTAYGYSYAATPLNVTYILGNIFVIIGTVALVVCTFFVLQAKYPKSLAKRSKG
jgi:hypothetical protein